MPGHVGWIIPGHSYLVTLCGTGWVVWGGVGGMGGALFRYYTCENLVNVF
jgi:hypothetical protein